MTPETRLLFEGTVRPLLNLGLCWDELRKAKEDAAGWDKWLQEERPQWVRDLHKGAVEATTVKVGRFQVEVDGLKARVDVARALVELEAAVVEAGGIEMEEQGDRRMQGVFGLILGPFKDVLDFAGSYSTLCGLGATASSLRAAVCALLPRLSLNDFGSAATTRLLGACSKSLLHLSLVIPSSQSVACAEIIKALDLPDRLEFFCFRFKAREFGVDTAEQQFTAALFSVPWSQLRVLDFERFSFFLNTEVSPSTGVGSGSTEDVQQQYAVLKRLPETGSLRFTRVPEPLMEFIQDRQLPSRLKQLTVDYSCYTPIAMSVSIFQAIGSGALPNLDWLRLIGQAPSEDPPQDFSIPANCLPRLRTLHFGVQHMPKPFITGLMGAAGPALSMITTRTEAGVANAVLELLASKDYPWRSGLGTLSLGWDSYDAAATVPQLITALARLPVLKAPTLRCPAYDDAIVHLMALIETGDLPNLAALTLARPTSNAGILSGGISEGVRLLLGLWLNRQARAGRLIECNIIGLRLSEGGNRTWAGRKTDQCITQVNEARVHM